MYGKIFEIMYDGSLYGQWEAIVTFQQMIVLADKEGFIDITPPALSARTSIPLDIIKKGIEILESDDPYSRTYGEDGKRIIRIDENRPWGWKIVNYKKYRDIATQEERREYMKEYMRDRRKHEKLTGKGDVNNGKQQLAELTHTDVDTDINTYAQTEFDLFWEQYPKKKSKGQAKRTWDKLYKKNKLPSLEILISAIKNQRISVSWKKDGGQFMPYPATWLNAEAWKDETESMELKTTPVETPKTWAGMTDIEREESGNGG